MTTLEQLNRKYEVKGDIIAKRLHPSFLQVNNKELIFKEYYLLLVELIGEMNATNYIKEYFGGN